MSMQQRPLQYAPVEPPPPGPDTAQCVIFGPARRPLCNQALRGLFAALAKATSPEAGRALRRRFWRCVSGPALSSLASDRPIHVQFALTVLSSDVQFDMVCLPLQGKRRPRAVRCFLTVQGLEHVIPHQAIYSSPPCARDIDNVCPWPMFTLSTRGRPVWANTAAKRFLGLSSDISGYDPLMFVHPDVQVPVSNLWQEALAHGQPLQLFARIKAANGVFATCLVRAEPYIDNTGRLQRWVCTALETQHHQWLDPKRQTPEAESIGNSFLTVASHELRTPLTSLQLNLQLALQRLQRYGHLSGADTSIENMVSRSLKQTHKLIEVVSDILDASRIHLGKLKLRQSRVDLHQLLLDTISLFDRPFADVGCRVTVQFPEHIYGHWDRGRVEQVFFDLLANVLKHAPGSHVTVTAVEDGPFAEVRVQDDGPGIDQALHERIFGRFGRAAECRGISGLGLGLYLCRRIVENHGGTLQVHSTPGDGSTFVARLPLQGGDLSRLRFARNPSENKPILARS